MPNSDYGMVLPEPDSAAEMILRYPEGWARQHAARAEGQRGERGAAPAGPAAGSPAPGVAS